MIRLFDLFKKHGYDVSGYQPKFGPEKLFRSISEQYIAQWGGFGDNLFPLETNDKDPFEVFGHSVSNTDYLGLPGILDALVDVESLMQEPLGGFNRTSEEVEVKRLYERYIELNRK